jgi:hypothetical protein
MTDIAFDKDLKHLKEDTERRFTEMVAGFNKSIELALNHSHTVETKIDIHIKDSADKSERDSKWQGGVDAKMNILIDSLSKK